MTGGSRKGEKRGGVRKKPDGMKPGLQFRKREVKKAEQDLAQEPIPNARTLRREEKDRATRYMILGEAPLMPRDVMLNIMRMYVEKANFHMQNHLDMADDEDVTDEQRDKVEAKAIYFLKEATDVAYKVAPYVHARLQAIQVVDNSRSAQSILGSLLEEIDAEARAEMKTIEHASPSGN